VWLWTSVVAVVLAAGSCSSSHPLPASESAPASGTASSPTAASAPTRADGAVSISVDTTTPSGTFDRRLLGTNVPAWVGPEKLADPAFIASTVASGATLLRMPGGSWSNAYNWSACEKLDEQQCVFSGAARPTDFIDFMQATKLPGSWTVSINETAQSAAAAVAFFNGKAGDARRIGVDRNGVDWGTVGTWAELRAKGGNADPSPIELWEVGNEVYGGNPQSGGAKCADYGWEEVWTCDGTTYVKGDSTHDGYLAIRAAMRAVDPTIAVGAVGVADPSGWNDWGNEVIKASAGQLDFYVVHEYGFDESPSDHDALVTPAELWPRVITDVRASLGDTTPIAITEYNLVSFEAGDTEQSMTKAVNALYLADSVGQMATKGVSIANQWNLANGTTSSGTDYGMISLDNGSHLPAFEAMRLWSGAGTELLAAVVDSADLHVYATRHVDGHISLLMVNLNKSATDSVIALKGESTATAQVSGVWTDDLAATKMQSTPESRVDLLDGSMKLKIPGWSITSVEVGPNGR
jgi:hypothetical protein